MVNANSGRIIEKTIVPKLPKLVENIDIDISSSASVPVNWLTSKVVRKVSAVRVQMIKVSKKTSNTPQRPCLTGSRVSDAECAITEEPRPASLENTPRAIPLVMTCAKV